MTRILEFQPADEDVIVSRVVTQVHKTVDREFPQASPPPRRFARTLFTEHDEPTVNQPLPGDPMPDMRESRAKAQAMSDIGIPNSQAPQSRRGEFGGEANLDFAFSSSRPKIIIGGLIALGLGIILYFLTAP